MPITTGLYIIKNIKQTNIAALADPNDGSPLAANARSYGDDEKWNVSLLGNGKYTIKNLQQASFANAGNRASAGATVEGRAQQQQWEIQETRVKGQYTIATTDSRIYWGLADDQPGTPIELSASATDTRNWWSFERA